MMWAASRSAQPGPQGTRTSKRTGDTVLALVTLTSELGEQGCGVFVGLGRVCEDAMNRADAGHHLAE